MYQQTVAAKTPLTRKEREALVKEQRRINARLIIGTRTQKEDRERLDAITALLQT